MGRLMRRYWVPVMLLSEIAEPDCAPVRVKILGERLLAFRDTQGRPGLIDEFAARTTGRASVYRGTCVPYGQASAWTPIVEVGRAAAEQVIARLEGRPYAAFQTLPFELVPRASTARPGVAAR